jgi:DGQHR domain-containing protein
MNWKRTTESGDRKNWKKFRALVSEQPGGTVYTISISGKELVHSATVLSRKDIGETGIQRVRSSGRCNRIAGFLAQDNAMLANNLVGNVPGDKFYYEDGYVYLHPELVHEIIDGQHRLWGFHEDHNEADVDFDIIYSFLVDADDGKRAALFYKINKEQKKVNPSLAFDLLSVMDEGTEEQKIAELVKQLNTDAESPFKGLIGIKEKEGGRISLANMTNKIRKFLRTPMGKRGFFINKALQQDALYLTLRNYFSAIEKTFPSEWADEESILVKTLGFGAFIELLGDVLIEHMRRHSDTIPKTGDLLEILAPLAGFDLCGEELTSFGGEKGQAQLASMLKEQLGFGAFRA